MSEELLSEEVLKEADRIGELAGKEHTWPTNTLPEEILVVEDFRIPGTDITLEKGDKFQVIQDE